jgi:hypothetical protein
LLSTYLTPKCPSASVKPVNQLLFVKFELSNKLSDMPNEYLALNILIRSLNLLFLGVLSLPCIKLIKSIIPALSPII